MTTHNQPYLDHSTKIKLEANQGFRPAIQLNFN